MKKNLRTARRDGWLSLTVIFLTLLGLSLGPGHAVPPPVITDSDGDTCTVALSGGGSVTVTQNDPGAPAAALLSSIALTGTKPGSVLSISVKKAAPSGDGKVSIGSITADGPLSAIKAPNCDLIGAGVTAAGPVQTLLFARIADGSDLIFGASAKPQRCSVTAARIGAATIKAPGSTLAITAQSIAAGSRFEAKQATALKTTDGSFAANVQIEGKVVAVSVAGGDLSGNIGAGAIGSIRVKKNKAGNGGSIINANIAAGSIGAVLVDRDIVNSLILAGANLGSDGALGGAGANADTFGAGSFRSLRVGRNVTGTVIGAGLSPVDGVLRDANDGVIGGKLSRLGSVTIVGQLDSTSLIAAGLLPKSASITKVRVNPSRDARFLSRAFVVPAAPVAPPLDPTAAAPAAVSTSFLYTGANAVQTGVAPGTIKPERAAVLRGRVLQRDGTALAGVAITALDRPEYGQTNSRADGLFDFAVNGGSPFVIKFEAAGFCPVQRQLESHAEKCGIGTRQRLVPAA